MSSPVTVDQLKAQAALVRAYWAQFPPDRMVKNAISGPGNRLLEMIERLPASAGIVVGDRQLEGGLVVSRALVERAYEVLNAGPGSAGIGKALLLLKEALG